LYLDRDYQSATAIAGDSHPTDPYWKDELQYAHRFKARVSVSDLKTHIRALQNRDAGIRYSAAEELGDLGDPRAIKHLARALKDEDTGVREAIVRSLRMLDHPRKVKPLIKSLGDKENSVRWYACEALGDLGVRKARAALKRALRDPAENIRNSASDALSAMGVRHRRPLRTPYLEPVTDSEETHCSMANQTQEPTEVVDLANLLGTRRKETLLEPLPTFSPQRTLLSQQVSPPLLTPSLRQAPSQQAPSQQAPSQQAPSQQDASPPRILPGHFDEVRYSNPVRWSRVDDTNGFDAALDDRFRRMDALRFRIENSKNELLAARLRLWDGQ